MDERRIGGSMRARWVGAAVAVAVLCGGCATSRGRELRAHAERHAPIVPEPVTARQLEPSVGYMLVNPGACFAGGGGGEGAALVAIACLGIASAVDLVALPVQAVRRHGQARELDAIRRCCPLEDPAARAAPALAARMVEELGFSPAPPVERAAADGEPAARPAAPGPVPVRVRVTTTTFERSSKVAWQGEVRILGPDGQPLFTHACGGEGPARPAESYAGECEAARGEVAALADRCVDRVMGLLHEAWPEWDPARAPPAKPPEPATPTGGY